MIIKKICEQLITYMRAIWGFIRYYYRVIIGREITAKQTKLEKKKSNPRPSARYYRKKERKPHLSVSQFIKLKNLFSKKKWPIVEDEDLSVFHRFYNTLLMLDEKEQDFLIKLTYRFDHIPLSEYMKYMKEPLRKLREDFCGAKLLFVTCTPKEDVGKVKSSSAVLYQFKGTTMKQYVDLSPKCVVENIQKLSEHMIADTSIIVLVDDFIGTGETALGAVDYLHELVPSWDNDRIIVFCIVALREGLERLANIGVKTYFAVERKKAISEEMEETDRDAAIAIMQSIERKLESLKDNWRFGYKGSEALVSLERCPNNSFPIYWLTKDVAPYER